MPEAVVGQRLAMALVTALGLAGAGAATARAQEAGEGFGAFTMGAAWKESGIARTSGPSFNLRMGRFFAPHLAYRVDGDLHWFQVKSAQRVDICGIVVGTCVSAATGNGLIRTLSVMPSVEWYERADQQGVYVVGGLGSQWMFSHPVDPKVLRLAVQGGLGVALRLGPLALVVEGRYQRALGASREVRSFFPVTAGLRVGAGR